MIGAMARTILVALDGSAREPEVFRTAARLAAAEGASLNICRAVTIPIGLPDAVWSMSMAQLDATLIAEAQRAADARAAEVPGAKAFVRMGQPADVVCDVAKELGADLVVIGAHGYGAIERLLGTTASKIVHRAPCSVLVVRPTA
jgi:nucleotide-binding universal stress UspA family protein